MPNEVRLFNYALPSYTFHNVSPKDDAVSALTGFSLDHILSDLSLPSAGLSNRLGISGIPTLSSSQIYNDKWDRDDGAVGAGEGEDFEDEVDRELKEEEEEEGPVKMEIMSPEAPPKHRRVRIVRRLVERPKTVYERFPSFEKDKVLDFTELFQGFAVKKSRVVKRPLQLESVYSKKRDVPKNFLDGVVGDTKRQVENERVEEVVSSGSIDHDLRAALERKHGGIDTSIPIPLHDRSFDLVLLSNWEDQIAFEPENEPPPVDPSRTDLMAPVNKALESGAWTQSIIWGPRAPFRDFTQIEFNNADDIIPEERPPTQEVRPRKRLRMGMDSAQVKDKFNLSNDQFYDVSKDGGRHRVRQTFGDLVVEHAYPSQKLQLPFYKTRLGKQEARSFHRPALQIPANIEIRFTKVRSAKKKKDKTGRRLGRGGNVGENLRRTSDLSLRDTSNFVLWEFSEEHPPIVANFGMGSILVNYYRKKSEKDEHIPKGDLGEPFVLEPQDESPFMKFGYVQPGQTMPALYSNLIRAPLFRHKPYHTDFLVIKNTTKSESKYYIREIKNLFVVGQTYPVTEVPGPHSRKITNTIKHRLQIIAYKLLAKSPGERLKISRLMKYFPDQNELQMRQRLKASPPAHGPYSSFWRLKPNWVVPSKAEMLKMVGPEQIVLSESMQVGQRHLQDAGYSGTQDTGGDDDDSHLSIEQQLAPWITTKNFIFATQAKAMLRLHGDGDPTGRGEAFSFIRVSMKDIFVKAGEDYEQKLAEAENRPKSAHRYNVAEQQLIYKSEIERIWKAQFASLSRKDEPQLSDDEDEKSLLSQRIGRRESRALSPAIAFTSGPAAAVAAPSPGFSRASSIERDRDVSVGPDGRRVLRIKRLIDGKWNTEIVRDAAVVRAYVRRRQIIEDETTGADTLAPTGDIDRDARAKKRLEEEIMRMKKNQERRLHRKNAKIAKEGGTPMTLNRPIKPDTTMGHMKTNRKCPRWAEFNSGTQPPATPTPTAAAAGSPPPLTPSLSSSLGLGQSSLHVPSPLATSPPVIAASDETPTAPKIKLTLKR
ncbi:TAF1 transcription initiation factor TFIID subunit TAF1 [Lactarius hatsudake]|nr:TAF1 transcription initiation factor TFIID subunit TAF1 [Lactarius hatsudake]